MKKPIYILVLSTLAIFTMSCDADTLAALTDLIAGTPGCTIEENDNYNAAATKHEQDSCATQIPGCTNSEALNYVEGATDDDGSCNLGITGCTDPYLLNYNSQATISVPDSCGAATTTAGCTDLAACNYNDHALSDCSNNTGTTDQTCCQPKFAVADTSIICYQDINENGYYEQMQTLTADNCGCDDLNTFLTSEAYGWSDNSNGEESAGCMDPSCPEYTASYNVNNYQCCITELADSTIFDEESENYIDELNYLGGYEMIMGSDCGGNQGGGSSGDTDKGFLFLGWDFVDNTGIYFTEMEKIHTVTGFPVEPAWDYNANNQNACEGAAQGGPWWCEGDIQGGWGQEFTPCHEAYYEQECWNNPECNWRWAECTQKPNEIQEACHQAGDGGPINDQTTCINNPGCQWEDGFDDWGNFNGQQPHCRFDCPGLSDTVCQSIPTECDWVLGGATGMQYCGFTGVDTTGTLVLGPAECGVANELLGSSNLGDCQWEPDDWNDFAGPGKCKCNTWDWQVDWTTACESLPEGFALVSESEPDYCEWHHEDSPCDFYTDPASCQADYTNHCMWDNWMWNDATQSQGICQQDPWFSDGNSCWDQSMQFATTCQDDSNCEWFDPGVDAGNPEWAQDGLCINFDPCHYIENYNDSGYEYEPQCNQDPNCYWDPGMSGQGEGCFENAYEQWCDCRYEYTSQTCTSPMFWENFDNFGGQCMNPMDQWSCEYGDSGPGDGYIDCSMYEDVDRFQEWNAATSTCTEIKSEFDEGEWYLDGGSLCHTKKDMGPECSNIYNFEECECAHECHWNGQGDATMDPPTWENNGTCDGGGPGRVSAHINPRINGTNSIYENVNPKLLQILYHINSSASSPDDYVCEPFTQLPNGDIEMTTEDGCTITLTRIEDDS